MKTNIKFRNCYKGIAIALLALTSFSACTSDDNEITADAYVRVVNASQGSSPQDFYLDSTKLTSSAVAYMQNSGYLTTKNGSKLGKFKTSGTANVNSSANINISAGKYYTVYYTGETSASAGFTATLDENVKPAANKARVRFVHLSSAAAEKIDLAIQGGAKIISDLAYRSASAYQDVDAATNFQIFAAGSTTAGVNIPALSLQAGKVYTVYISGSSVLSITYHVLIDKE